MTRLADSPLDEPPPPPLEWRFYSRPGFLIIFSIIGLIGIAGFIWRHFILIRNFDPPAETSEAVLNLRQLGLALFEFEKEYGSLPNESTIPRVLAETKTDLNLGNKSSNDFFRQLLTIRYAPREKDFHAKIPGVHKPDEVITGDKALEKCEVGFAYIMGSTKDSNPSRPLVMAPVIPGTDRFDPKPFKGRALVLRLDNSVTSMKIGDNGRIMTGDHSLMDPHNLIWGDHPPVIVWPAL